MHGRAPRTLLEQLVKRSRQTIGEHCAAFEKTARRHGEDVSLCPRHLSRWMAGKVTMARPVAQRVALLHWGYEFEELVGPPQPEAALEPAIAATCPTGRPGSESTLDRSSGPPSVVPRWMPYKPW